MPIVDPFYTDPRITAEDRKKALIPFRRYQEWVFYSEEGVLVLHWARQIGKSFTLGAWAIFRLIRYPGRLVTVLSNSKQNGMEFIVAAAKVAELVKESCNAKVDVDYGDEAVKLENMRMEIRMKINSSTRRIIVLPANPRTARGFSGDLILDEFAFHEDSAKIWDAAEPIISANPNFHCRIASTGNGRFNMFYRMANETSPYTVSRVRRTEAHKMGVKVYDPRTKKVITPEQARRVSMDKASYDQNYECAFNDENTALLTHALISACEYTDGRECLICDQDWSSSALDFLERCQGPLGIGLDIGRHRDMTCITVGERVGGVLMVRCLLRVQGVRLPEQLKILKPLLGLPNFGRLSGDSTGMGLGLIEFAQALCGPYRVEAVQFASKEKREVRDLEQEDRAYVTEIMALDLLKVFEDGNIRIPAENELRDSLRKPERIAGKSGVRIAATRDEAGHADEFWSLALMVRALTSRVSAFSFQVPEQIEDGVPRPYNRRDQRAAIALM